jgi:hypothetical protein
MKKKEENQTAELIIANKELYKMKKKENRAARIITK